MTRQPSSFPAFATRARVRHGYTLLPASIAMLIACAGGERLSLGRHEPSGGLAAQPGAAGGAAAAPAGPGSDLEPAGMAAPIAPAPRAQPMLPGVPPPGGAGSAALDAGSAEDAQPCAASTYVAELWCAVDPSSIPRGAPRDPRATAPMQAVLRFTIAPTTAPQRLDVREGTLRFEYMSHAFEGQLEGALDCTTQQFRADIVDGSFTALFAGPSMSGRFHGQIEGQIDPMAAMLTGSWWHGPAGAPAGAPTPSCVGTWVAHREP